MISPTAFIEPTSSGKWRVRFRLGGRETYLLSGGTLSTLKAARERKQLVEMEIAAGRDPRLKIAELARPAQTVTLAEAGKRWQASRHDVTEGTAKRHRAQLEHSLRVFGDRLPETITAAEVSTWVGEMAAAGTKPDYVRKIVNVLGMVLDHHGVMPNPVRDPRVKMPRSRRKDVDAPETDVLLASFSLLPPRYVFASLVLDATAMRVSELENLTWADVDAANGRVRVNAGAAKTRAGGRWVPVPEDVMAAVEALVPREDRDLERRVVPWFEQSAYRTAIRRAVTAAGTASWSPHGLRRRRISLWHRAGVSWAQIGEWAGQRDLSVTANAYTRVMVGAEIKREDWLTRTMREVKA